MRHVPLGLFLSHAELLETILSLKVTAVNWENKFNLRLNIYDGKLPEFLINKIYKRNHEIIYSIVMKQLSTYRSNTVFVVSFEFWNMDIMSLVTLVVS